MGPDKERTATLEGLKSATRFLQNGLDRLALKRTPVLVIVPDDTMERADRILRLIDDAISDNDHPPIDGPSDVAAP
jgi:ribosome-binding factor A